MGLFNDFTQIQNQRSYRGDWEALLKRGQDVFSSQGLPTRSNEDWKYTSTKILKDETFASSLLATAPTTNLQVQISPLKTAAHFVFVNGHFMSNLSQTNPSVTIQTISQLATSNETSLLTEIEQLKQTVSATSDSLDALNEAYLGAGLALLVKAETKLDHPIRLTFYSDLFSGPALATHPKMLVKVGSRSSVQVIEEYVGQEGARYFNNTQADVVVEDSAKLVHVRVQNDSLQAVNVGRTRFFLKSNSNLHVLAYSSGARLSRHNNDIHFIEPGASAKMDGLYLTAGAQHVDNHTFIDHKVGNCQSYQHYKGILVDQSRAVFNGRVLIRQDSQKAYSEQLNNNLLLSSQAEIDTKPQLEIFADDVKATHGSTVGELNEEEVFYLLSRAIPRDQALAMLSLGFVQELVLKLENPELETWLSSLLTEAWKRIRK
ncbi:MAG: Fe-S cluster assembly protein SufD [Oligoflexia bacterium]|nr:MAG: Fe-S cluster assembly protein SufD [Oligoflexia bacterium]